VKLSNGFISDANADVVSAGNGTWVSSPDEGVVYRLAGRENAQRVLIDL